MFGFVTANIKELSKEQKDRYSVVYCGICRQIRDRSGQLSRMALRYDMAFLALLHMSLYEPEETGGTRACVLHPLRPRPWADNLYIQYAADMNVALAYYQALDDWTDDGRRAAKAMAGVLGKHLDAIEARFPRQCAAIRDCIQALSRLEKESCDDPDECANCFGQLMGELMVYTEDLWASTLRKMGRQLGRFIYLADAAADYSRDLKKHRYNPYIAMGTGKDPALWEQHLVLTMAKCTQEFEKLPLVQDKPILDNILYSGIWCGLGRKKKGEGAEA